jgi:hypothetical protein
VADIDATFKQQIFDLPQRKRIPDVHHHREADYLRRTIEYRNGFCIAGSYGTSNPGSSRFGLKKPKNPIDKNTAHLTQ